MQRENKVIQGDCLEVMKDMPDKSVDLIITDPPYLIIGNGFQARGGFLGQRDVISNIEGIKDGFDFKVLDEFERVCKKINYYIYCNKDLLFELVVYFKKHKKKIFLDILTEHITNPTPFCNNTYLNDTDYILFVRESGSKVRGKYKDKQKYQIKSTNVRDKKLFKHPTCKMPELVEKYIINSSDENDVILDPFAGSGTTGVACKNLNRNYILIEKEPEYIEIINQRLK
jgi:site-specific DNA-methyltransferase (adenine-specific)